MSGLLWYCILHESHFSFCTISPFPQEEVKISVSSLSLGEGFLLHRQILCGFQHPHLMFFPCSRGKAVLHVLIKHRRHVACFTQTRVLPVRSRILPATLVQASGPALWVIARFAFTWSLLSMEWGSPHSPCRILTFPIWSTELSFCTNGAKWWALVSRQVARHLEIKPHMFFKKIILFG